MNNTDRCTIRKYKHRSIINSNNTATRNSRIDSNRTNRDSCTLEAARPTHARSTTSREHNSLSNNNNSMMMPMSSRNWQKGDSHKRKRKVVSPKTIGSISISYSIITVG